jgi:hypothetical protein
MDFAGENDGQMAWFQVIWRSEMFFKNDYQLYNIYIGIMKRESPYANAHQLSNPGYWGDGGDLLISSCSGNWAEKMSSVDGQFQATEIGNHNVLIRLWGNAQTGGFDWFWFSGGMFSNNHWMDCRGQFTLTIYRQDPITSDSMSIQSIHNYIIQVYQVCMYHHVS